MIVLGDPRCGLTAVDRGADRLVAMTSIVVALGSVEAAAVALFLPAAH